MSNKSSNLGDQTSSSVNRSPNHFNQSNISITTNSADLNINETTTDDNDTELRAQFASSSLFGEGEEIKSKPQTSPLLSSTPPTVAKSLIKAYPYLLIVNKWLSIVTWTNDDYWVNIIIVSVYALIVLYFESLVTWFGHLIIVGIITLYALLNNKIVEETNLLPTLDDVVQALTTTCIKADLLLTPITSLSLTAYDIKRLLFTTVFLTPIYLIITFLLIKPRTILLITGIYILTYHSSYSRITRKILWKIKLARLLCFYLTGLDFSQAKNHSLFAAAFAKVQRNAGHTLNTLSSNNDNKPVRFTYVIYENQRRWLGIGWTSNLLSYERTPWTDEFLNESSSIEIFQLPNTENIPFDSQKMNGASWRWVDKTWRLDLTNDGAITLPNNKRSKTTANPSPDEGFIYYDNTWKKPSTEDSFSKYTRRRRWIRTAELVFNNNNSSTTKDEEVIQSTEDSPKVKKRKNLRFAEPEEEIEEPVSNHETDLKQDLSSSSIDQHDDIEDINANSTIDSVVDSSFTNESSSDKKRD